MDEVPYVPGQVVMPEQHTTQNKHNVNLDCTVYRVHSLVQQQKDSSEKNSSCPLSKANV